MVRFEPLQTQNKKKYPVTRERFLSSEAQATRQKKLKTLKSTKAKRRLERDLGSVNLRNSGREARRFQKKLIEQFSTLKLLSFESEKLQNQAHNSEIVVSKESGLGVVRNRNSLIKFQKPAKVSWDSLVTLDGLNFDLEVCEIKSKTQSEILYNTSQSSLLIEKAKLKESIVKGYFHYNIGLFAVYQSFIW